MSSTRRELFRSGPGAAAQTGSRRHRLVAHLNVKEKEENVEVFVFSQGDKISSCLILAAEARELSVVYIMGTLTVAQMKDLVDSDIAYNLARPGSSSKPRENRRRAQSQRSVSAGSTFVTRRAGR